jgi:hypothetical protein
MKIQVAVKSNYGSQAVYPRCAAAQAFCKIARQDTMTPHTIKSIRAAVKELTGEELTIDIIQPTVKL